jgi:hypothetical protein
MVMMMEAIRVETLMVQDVESIKTGDELVVARSSDEVTVTFDGTRYHVYIDSKLAMLSTLAWEVWEFLN